MLLPVFLRSRRCSWMFGQPFPTGKGCSSRRSSCEVSKIGWISRTVKSRISRSRARCKTLRHPVPKPPQQPQPRKPEPKHPQPKQRDLEFRKQVSRWRQSRPKVQDPFLDLLPGKRRRVARDRPDDACLAGCEHVAGPVRQRAHITWQGPAVVAQQYDCRLGQLSADAEWFCADHIAAALRASGAAAGCRKAATGLDSATATHVLARRRDTSRHGLHRSQASDDAKPDHGCLFVGAGGQAWWTICHF
jgi:hypothetical protein